MSYKLNVACDRFTLYDSQLQKAFKAYKSKKYGVWMSNRSSSWGVLCTCLLHVSVRVVTSVRAHIHTCRHVHGLIFLYKWRQGEEPRGSIVEDSRLEEIFFSKQVSNKDGR